MYIHKAANRLYSLLEIGGHFIGKVIYSGPCILRPPFQLEKYGLKWEVVLKWSDIYTENIRLVSLIAGLKMKGNVKWRGLK